VPTSSLLFRDAMPLLARRYRVLAPDLPGYGETEALSGDHSVGAHAAWLLALLDALELDRVALAGQDLGGLLGIEAALAGRVRRLVLTSCPAGLGWMSSRVMAWPGLELFFYRLFAGRLYLSKAERAGPLQALHIGRIASEGDAFVERMRATALAFGLREFMARPGRLRASGVPVSLVWGDEDPLFPSWQARATAKALNAPLTLVPGGRHTLPFDRPRVWSDAVLTALG
jgi:pimeloyl-ACP methyl ester carboxylesterase